MSTTIAPLHLLLSDITQGVLKPNLIIKNNSDSIHDYQLTPYAAHIIQKSDLIFFISKNFEPFTHKKLTQHWVELFPLMPTVLDTPQPDIHIWLDPNNAIKIVQMMTAALLKHDPNNAQAYSVNSAQLIQKIRNLTDEIQSSVSQLPNKQYVIIHNAYAYFMKYFNIPTGITILNNQHNINPRTMQRLQHVIKKGPMCFIADPYNENIIPNKILQKSKLVIIDPIGQRFNNYLELLGSVANGFISCLKS